MGRIEQQFSLVRRLTLQSRRRSKGRPVRAGDPGYGPLWTVMGMA